jgi:hypothetical protein
VLLVAVPGIPSVCPMRALLHMPCPSCGLTRAARLVLGGDIAAATAMHPLWFLVLPFVGIVAGLESATYVRDGAWGRIAGQKGVKWAAWGLVAALVGVWIARELGALGGPVPLS